MALTNTSYIQIDPADNVLVALQDLPAGKEIIWKEQRFELLESIPAKHKFFIEDVVPAGDVIMYGVLVGKAQSMIRKGALMTTENVKHAAEPYAYRDVNYQWTAPDASKFQGRTFNGYHRSNGEVGTANYWLFIPTVFCENRNLDVIKEALYNELGYSVTGKYRAFTRELLAAYEAGQDLTSLSLEQLATAVHRKDRVFKNVDGIKFLNHQGGC